MRRRVVRIFVHRPADFLVNSSCCSGGIFSCGNGPSHHDVSCACAKSFGGSHNPGLVSVIGTGGSDTRIDDQKIASQLCPQSFDLAC